MVFKVLRKKNKTQEDIVTIIFFLFIVIGGFLNIYSNKTYQFDSWTIGEWLINYQGGFVRRGLLGEIIYFLTTSLNISPIFIIWLLCITSYYFLLKITLDVSRNIVSKVFLLSPSVFLAPVVGDFLVRKDIFLLLLFLINLRIIKSSQPNYIIFCLINIFAILTHEAFAIYSLPIQIFLIWNKKLDKYQNRMFIFVFLLSFVIFLLCFFFKGNSDQAIDIHNSWVNQSFLFPYDNLISEVPIGAIQSIGWNLNNIFEILKISLFDIDGIIWIPMAWIFSILIISVIFLGDKSNKDQKIKIFIISFQFLPLLILCFSGWDYGRWIFIWIVSSILVYCLFGRDIKGYKLVNKLDQKFIICREFMLDIEINKQSKFILAFFAYPHCCWSIYYLPSLLIVPIYLFFKSLKFEIK